MPVKIRLSRVGKKHVPFYRVIATDVRAKRDGAYLANIGTYDAVKGNIISFNAPLYEEWVSKGAQATLSAQKIYNKYVKRQTQTVSDEKEVAKVTKPRKSKKIVSENA